MTDYVAETLAGDLLKGVPAIAGFLGFTERAVYRYLENGTIPARKLGKLWVASRATLAKHFGVERGAA